MNDVIDVNGNKKSIGNPLVQMGIHWWHQWIAAKDTSPLNGAIGAYETTGANEAISANEAIEANDAIEGNDSIGYDVTTILPLLPLI